MAVANLELTLALAQIVTLEILTKCKERYHSGALLMKII